MENVCINRLKTMLGNPKLRLSPDRTETGPRSGDIFKNIFGSDRVGEFYISGWSGSGYFLPGDETFFPRDFGDRLES